MVSPEYKSYHEINFDPLTRVRVLINNKYLFTIGAYRSEMGFFIDFPNFSEYESDSANIMFPKGITQDHDISLKDGKKENFTPKISFHKSGEVLFSRKEWFTYKAFARNKTGNSIYKHHGEHIFTIMFQNISLLENDDRPEKKKISHLDFPFQFYPPAVKFVGNLWREQDLQQSFPELGRMKYLQNIPLTWPRTESGVKNLHDLIGLIKLNHIPNEDPLYLTLRCIPISLLDPSEKNHLVAIMTGWKFEEMKDGKNDAHFIGLIARKVK